LGIQVVNDFASDKDVCSNISQPGRIVRMKRINANYGAGVSMMVLAVLGFLQGCAVGPDYQTPETQVPDQWQQKVAAGQVDLQTWWTLLDDPVLDSLIDRSTQGNLNLRIAVARIVEARAQLGIASGQYWPAFEAVGAYSYSRTSENGPGSGLGLGGNTSNLYNLGIDATWEIDAFGRIKRSVESAEASMQASFENFRDLQVTLYGEIALNYILVRSLQERIAYVSQNIDLQRKTLQLTKDRRAAELVPALDVSQAELNLASTEAAVPALQIQLTQSINRLAVLIGTSPGTLQAELEDIKPIPDGPDEVLAGLPTELLRQRPDIRRAERQLAAQTAQIGVAKAALYPTFSLSGTFAFEAEKISDLGSWGSRTFNIVPAVRWNIFDGNRIRSNILVQEARTEQLLLQYEQTVLSALEEVEGAMVAYLQEKQRAAALLRSVTASRKSVELVDTLYKNGLVNFQNVLDMQRSLAAQEDQLATSQGQVTQNLVRVYKALGGGWSHPATEPSNTTSNNEDDSI
jgi:NodT family efflux transporter outer membrane factor (OMF) lipoprotein